MKPYFYILAVLLVGGSIGYFIGRGTAGSGTAVSPSTKTGSNDQTMIEAVLNRQKEAFATHDELLIFRDCLDSYVEIDATTGEEFNLEKAIIQHHELFRPGKSVKLLFEKLDVELMENAALVRGTYSKTSDAYEQQGFSGLTGKVVWLLSKEGERWKIAASAWTAEKKQ